MEILPHLLIGPLMLLISWIFMKNPPKKINHLYGYRTKRSMRNEATWKAANAYSFDLMVRFSAYLCIGQIALYFLFPGEQAILIAAAILVVGLIAILPMTENYLKAEFDEEGRSRNHHPSA